MVNQKEANIRFFNLLSRTYDYGPIGFWCSRMQRKVLENVPVNNKSSVLDVGCGTGKALRYLAKKGVRKLTGMDLSPGMIKQARKKLGKKAVLKVGSVDKIPFKVNSFDFVLNTEAFHHFPDPQKSVNEMKRVLKKGRSLYLADFSFSSNIIRWLFKALEPGHVKIYSSDEFHHLFHNAGLEILLQKRIGFFVLLTVGRK